MLYPSKQITVMIERSADAVYAYASNGITLPRWAKGLVGGEIRRAGEEWIADTPTGPIRIRFAAANPYGVLDHLVTLPDGVATLNPMRVVPNGDGAEVMFAVRRLPGKSEESFAADAALVEADLLRLKELLERS